MCEITEVEIHWNKTRLNLMNYISFHLFVNKCYAPTTQKVFHVDGISVSVCKLRLDIEL